MKELKAFDRKNPYHEMVNDDLKMLSDLEGDDEESDDEESMVSVLQTENFKL